MIFSFTVSFFITFLAYFLTMITSADTVGLSHLNIGNDIQEEHSVHQPKVGFQIVWIFSTILKKYFY